MEMIESDDKTPLFEDDVSRSQKSGANAGFSCCLSCFKHLWITVMLLIAGVICGVGTYGAVYGLVQKPGPCPSEMMCEPCFAVISTFFNQIIDQPSPRRSENFLEKIATKVNTKLAIERLEYHVQLRNQYYVFDPITILKCILIAATFIFLLRILVCCFFTNGEKGLYFFWFFTIYYLTLLTTLGAIAVMSIPLFDKNNPKSCDKQFWGF